MERQAGTESLQDAQGGIGAHVSVAGSVQNILDAEVTHPGAILSL